MEWVRIPLMNANDEQVMVTSVRVREGDVVRTGEVLCVIESTKAAMDVEAPASGYVRALSVTAGEAAAVGAVICALTASPEEPAVVAAPGPTDMAPRATRKARELAAAHGIELEQVPSSGIIKEEDVRGFLAARRSPDRDCRHPAPLACAPGAKPLILLGASGHAKVLIDLVRASGSEWTIVGAVDDFARGDEVLGIPILGTSADLKGLRAAGIEHAALGIGSVEKHRERKQLYEKLLALGFTVPNLVHPRAAVEASARVGKGNQIFAGAVVGSSARLGQNAIINSGVVVSHDCVIGSHTHLAPGCILAGGVRVGENTLIGMGATIYLGLTIGSNVVIANGAHIMKDVPDGAIVRALQHGGQE